MTGTGATDRSTPPTLVEVARLAGVSRATASRAVNGGDRVSSEALEAVRAAVRELGYRPNPAARSLVTRRTDSIAVVIPESDSRLFTDPFFATILHGVTSALASTDLQIVLLIGGKGEQSARMLSYLRSGHTDGAIVVSHHRSDNVAEVLASSAMPSVFIGRPWSPTETPVSWVDVDNFTGGVLAVEHLVARGARRLGTVTGPQDMGASVDRLAGWRAAVTAAGLPADAVVHSDFTTPGATRATEELLAIHPDVDGLFVASDLMAAAALQVLEAHGRRVPDDVRVVGFDNMELATTVRPALSTLVNPATAMARRAVEMLLDQLRSAGGTAPELLATELVVRDSS